MVRSIRKLDKLLALIITGTVREEARSVGGFELGVNSIQINQISEEYPISGFLS